MISIIWILIGLNIWITVETCTHCFMIMYRYYTDPSGTFWQCNAKAIGSGSEGADSSLQEQYNKVSNFRLSKPWH